ncbi:MAG: hypothetical protein RLO08_00250 [Parvibaculaceae bacterium]
MNQELSNTPPVTVTFDPRLQPVKYEKIRLEPAVLPNSAFANSLDEAAAALEREARRLRRSAEAARERDRNERELRARLDAARAIARKALASGQPFGIASHAVMSASAALPPETAIYVTQQEARALDRQQRQRRNETIMRLKSQGLTNAKIAARLQMHEKSVARIVGQMRRG